MEILAKLFGTATKVKLMRLFLFNADRAFTVRDIANRAKVTPREAQKEILSLGTFEIIKPKLVSKDIHVKRHKKMVTKKVQEKGYVLNQKFPYLSALKNLLTVTSIHVDDTLVKKFAKVGKIKLFIASGVFLQQWDSRVDLLIVGDEISTVRLEKAIASLEAEIGKEISYSAFDTVDFEYRLGIHDRLVRDILDFQHITLIDRLGIEPK